MPVIVHDGTHDPNDDSWWQEGTDPHADHTGHVYVLWREYGDYKIGSAKNLKTRLRRLEKQYKFRFTLVCSIFSDNCWKYELELHRKYQFQRVKCPGDWFRLTSEDLAHLRLLAWEASRAN